MIIHDEYDYQQAVALLNSPMIPQSQVAIIEGAMKGYREAEQKHSNKEESDVEDGS